MRILTQNKDVLKRQYIFFLFDEKCPVHVLLFIVFPTLDIN
jgi:hypothetical protein